MDRIKSWFTTHWLPVICLIGPLFALMILLSANGNERSSLFVPQPGSENIPWDGAVDGRRVSWSGVVKANGLWFNAVEIGLSFATYHQTIGILSGVLMVGDCRYSTRNMEIRDNALLFFEADEPCRLDAVFPKAAFSAEVPFSVSFEVDEARSPLPPRIAAWAHYGWAARGFLVGGGPGRRPLFDELVHRYQHPISRWELLGVAWGLSKPMLAGVLFIAFVFLGGGLALWNRTHRNIATACLFISMSLITSVLVPPFHAPDEPDHFLSYARITGQTNLIKDALAVANKGHFPVIRHNPSGSFNQYEVDYPTAAPWQMSWQGGVYDSKMEVRAPLVASFWMLAAKLFQGSNASTQLLGLRCISSVTVGVLVFFVGWLLSGRIKDDGFSWTILLAPAIPFFAMHVSNYSYLLGLTLIAVAAALASGRGGFRWAVVGIFLSGLTVTACIFVSRNGLLLLPLVGCLLLMQFGLRIWSGSSSLSRALQWLCVYGLLFPLSVIPVALGIQTAEISKVAKKIASTLSISLNAESMSWIMVAALGGGWFMLLTLVATTLFWLKRSKYTLSAIRRWVLPAIPYLLAIGWTGLCFKLHYRLPAIEGAHQVEFHSYLLSAVKTFARDLTPFGNDFLISASFWTGYGWLEATFPEWFARLVKFVPLFLIALGLWSGRSRLQVWWKFSCFSLALLGALLLSAAGAYSVRYNLHGRYLLSFYGCWLIFASAMVWQFCGNSRMRQHWITSVMLIYICSIYVFTWSWVLSRYF